MNNTHPIPYEILLERYLEYKISALNNEIDAWQKAYEDYSGILSEHGLI